MNKIKKLFQNGSVKYKIRFFFFKLLEYISLVICCLYIIINKFFSTNLPYYFYKTEFGKLCLELGKVFEFSIYCVSNIPMSNGDLEFN